MNIQGGILVLDFGSQLTQLIARRVREMGVYSEIRPFDLSLEKIKDLKPSGIILSGGPSSVYDNGSPLRSDLADILNLAPVLGICYGMQLLAHTLGGKVSNSKTREYGRMPVKWLAGWGKTFKGRKKWAREGQLVWMSHGDLVTKLPPGAKGLAKSKSGHWAAMSSETPGRGFMALQFHPEVTHTQSGGELLSEFVLKKCRAKKNWSGKKLLDHLIEQVRAKVADKGHVLCGLSGGVDSTVTAVLLSKALGADRVHSVFVDTGLMRLNETELVMSAYKKIGLRVTHVDASKEFLTELAGVFDPEKKRKIIGRVFIEVFEKATRELTMGGPCQFLAQGTLYPDVIESVSLRGSSVTIKSHHNVGGLPEKMNLKLVEPLRELFKDEVRALGRQLKIPQSLLGRHPFPGPGLAVRVLGPIVPEELDMLRHADDIFISELRANGLYDKIWQAFVVLLPIKTVGVMGDGRTYDRVAALRAVTSVDGMTADWYHFDAAFLAKVSNRITNEVKGINRVVYDISSKPPATIEWE